MEEGTYYRISAPLSIREKEDIMFIWMDNIMEDVYIRRTKIENYCRNNKKDVLSALFYIYSDIQHTYLCRNNPMNYNTGYRYFYECYYSSYSLKKHFEDFLRGENEELTEIQQNNINKMFEKLEKDLYYSNSDALKDGFIDFEKAEILSISKHEVNSDCNYLSIIIKEMIDERRRDSTQFRDPIVLEEEIAIFMSDLEEQMYIPYDKMEDIESSKKEEIEIPSLKSLLNLVNSENHFSVEVINAIVSNLTKDYSILLIDELVIDTKKCIHDSITYYFNRQNHKSEEENNLFYEDFDEVFQKGIDDYLNDGFFDNCNLKLRKLFSKDEFRQLKFILDRLREIRDERSNINVLNTNIETSKQEVEKSYKTKYTYEELVEIFNKSMDEKLFDRDTKLEDFLYVFGGEQKPNDFTRINWIKTGRSKSINKKLLIYFFMKIYDIKRDDVLTPFLTFINSRVQTKENPLNLKNKPDSDYNPKELEGFFPKK